MPLVVWPTRFFLLRVSNSVLKSALRRVLLPDDWEPMTDTIWYYLPNELILALARPYNSYSL